MTWAAAVGWLMLASLTATTPKVFVVEPDATGQAEPALAATASQAYDHCCAALKAAQVPFTTTSDSQITAQGLYDGGGVAIFPFNHHLAPGESQRILVWLATGGRAIFVHALPAEVASAAGMSDLRAQQARLPGQFRKMVFSDAKVLGMPAEVDVDADWAYTVNPGVAVVAVGYYASASGQASAGAAVYLSPRVAYVTCLLNRAPEAQAGSLLRALAGRLAPGLWDALLPPDPLALGPLEGAPNLAALVGSLAARTQEGPQVARALEAAREAAASLGRARSLLHDGFPDAAVSLASAARRAANQAYWMSFPTRAEELRGVWAGPKVEPSWDEAAQALAAAHFNVVFPYMATGAAAYYPSSVLPPAAQTDGHDWLATAVAACHRNGIKIEPRILGLSCMFSTDETRHALAAAGRLMVGRDGKTLPWLCPTCPENRRMLVAAAVEMVTKYPVDGLQFDYYRYPGYDACLCPRCRKAFEKYFGRPIQNWPESVLSGPAKSAFLEFRRRQLTSLLAEIRAAVEKARPGLPVSAAVFANWAVHRDEIGQDWVNWLKQGLVDFACPMDYTPDVGKFTGLADRQRGWCGDGDLAFGIGPYADRMGNFPVLAVAQEIAAARRRGQGWVLFNLQPALLSRDLPRLSAGVTYAEATLPGWAGGPAPSPSPSQQ